MLTLSTKADARDVVGIGMSAIAGGRNHIFFSLW
jgi:hypothetical protein